MSVVRMRFAQDCVEELRREDPDTPISLNYIRALAKQGVVPSVPIGKRRLINFDALCEYLAAPHTEQTPTVSGIRRIAE